MGSIVASGKMLLCDRRTSQSEEPHDEPEKHVSTNSTTERELLEAVQPRYLKASKVEKQKILDEFTSATRYHRKHAIRVLKNQVQNHRKGKTKTYQTLKRYDTAKTPYRRVLERKDISAQAKARRMNLYLQLNPAELRRRIDQKTAKLWKISR